MDEITKQIEEARTLLNEIETYCFENKKEKYSELKTSVTDILSSKLDDLDDFKYVNTEDDTKALLNNIMDRLNKYMQALKTIDDIKFDYDEFGNVSIVDDEKVMLSASTSEYDEMELATDKDDDIIEKVNDELGLDSKDTEMPTIVNEEISTPEVKSEINNDAINFDEPTSIEEDNSTNEFSAIDDFLNNQLNDANLRVA